MSQSINVNTIPDNSRQLIHASQYDVGRTIKFKLFENSLAYTVPTGAAVKIQGTKPSGLGFSIACAVNGNEVTATTTEAMTQEWGSFPVELQITKNNDVLGTVNFILDVEKSPHPENTTDGTLETIPELTERLDAYEQIFTADIAESVSNWLDEHPEATTTVEDGSITEAKLNSSLVGKINTIQNSTATNANDIDVLDAQFQTAVSALTVDSEVENIRVGADGVTYPSAGDAVRTQVSDLKSALKEQAKLIGVVRNTVITSSSDMSIDDSKTEVYANNGDVLRLSVSGSAITSGGVAYYTRSVGSSNFSYLTSAAYNIEKEVTLSSDISGVAVYIGSGLTAGKDFTLTIKNMTRGLYKTDLDLANAIEENADDIDAVAERVTHLEGAVYGDLTEFEGELYANYTYIALSDCNTDLSAMPTDKLIINMEGDAINTNTEASLYLDTTNSGNLAFTKIYKKGSCKNIEYKVTEQIYKIGFYITGLTAPSTISKVKISVTVASHDVPNYYKAYLQTKIDRINQLANSCVANGDMFAFITDEHWELNEKQSPKLLNALYKECLYNRVFSGGDTGDIINLEFCNALRDMYPHNIHHVIGNHDWFSPADGNMIYHYADIYNDNQVGNAYEHYYYVDNPQQKIRYIILSSYTRNNGTLESGYTQEQLSWLTNSAINVPNGWSVVVFAHDAMPTTIGWNDFKSALDSAKTGGTDIIAIISGHAHYDTIAHTSGGIPIVVTTCDKSGAWIDSQHVNREPWLTEYRIPGTTSEQAFDMVFINKTTRTMTLVRIGALAMNNVDKWDTDTGFTYVGTLEERTVNY